MQFTIYAREKWYKFMVSRSNNENKSKGSNNNKNKNKNNIYMDDDQEENEDDTIVQFFEGDVEIPLKEGETVLWSGLLSDSSAIR